MTVPRSRADGVKRIIAFNWPKLVLAAGVTAAALGVRQVAAAPVIDVLAGLTAAATTYFLVASLIVSWWVYDRSDLHGWGWLVPLLPTPLSRWALVHAGFDETGPSLPMALGAPEAVVDLTPWLHGSSPSHRRARRRYPATSTAVAGATALPMATSSCDGILLIFSAHEVRDRQQREELFDELHRVLRPAGRIVLVEHLRDLPNLVAFGPGALHFQTRREWERLARGAGFTTVQEVAKTSFVRGFALCPS